MHARIATWRIAADDYAAFDREVAPVVAQIKAQPGYVGGYQLRTAPDRVMTLTDWKDQKSIECLDRQSYPAEEWA